jgi:hypothetical protein
MRFQLPLPYTALQSNLGGFKRKAEIVRLKAAQALVCRKRAMGWKLGVVLGEGWERAGGTTRKGKRGPV